MRKALRCGTPVLTKIAKINGGHITSREGILDTVTEFYEKLYRNDRPTSVASVVTTKNWEICTPRT